jgi:molybdopterin synthase sulfur carrier subunit
MQITVRYFAAYREVVGHDREALEVADGATVSDFQRELAQRHPGLTALLARSTYAVNRRYVPPDTPLHDGDELVFIPPMGGGSGEDAHGEREARLGCRSGLLPALLLPVLRARRQRSPHRALCPLWSQPRSFRQKEETAGERKSRRYTI